VHCAGNVLRKKALRKGFSGCIHSTFATRITGRRRSCNAISTAFLTSIDFPCRSGLALQQCFLRELIGRISRGTESYGEYEAVGFRSRSSDIKVGCMGLVKSGQRLWKEYILFLRKQGTMTARLAQLPPKLSRAITSLVLSTHA
jgi:hypothetical protein